MFICLYEIQQKDAVQFPLGIFAVSIASILSK